MILLHKRREVGRARLHGRVVPGSPAFPRRQIRHAGTDGKGNVQTGTARRVGSENTGLYRLPRGGPQRVGRGLLTTVFHGHRLYRYVSVITKTENESPVSPERGHENRHQKQCENGFRSSHLQ